MTAAERAFKTPLGVIPGNPGSDPESRKSKTSGYRFRGYDGWGGEDLFANFDSRTLDF
jgi:hypothetical protein